MLQLWTLGGLALQVDGRALTGAASQRSRVALLAVLAVAGDRGISRDRLLALLWPESDTETARGALNQALYALRRDAGERDLTTGSSDLSLNHSVVWSDVREFETAFRNGVLERAVEVYGGTFLDGVHLASCEFDRWLGQEQHRLALAHQQAIEGLARAAENSGDYQAAVKWWRAGAAADPLSAPVARWLIQVMVKAGDTTGALRHARVYEELVRSELGSPLEPVILQLIERIRDGSEARVVNPTNPIVSAAACATHETAGAASATSLPPLTDPATAHPSVGLPSHRAIRRWVPWQVGIVLGGLVLSAAAAVLSRSPELEPGRVVLAVKGGPASTLDSLMLERVQVGLQERGGLRTTTLGSLGAPEPAGREGTSAQVSSLGQRANARYVVELMSSSSSDSMWFQAEITDALTGASLGLVDPVVVPIDQIEAGTSALRDQIAIALASHRDPTFASWARAAAMPRTWESFDFLNRGINEWVAEEESEARSHFSRAAALDPTSSTPLVWEAFILSGSNERVASDSILDHVLHSVRRFGLWDRAMVAYIRAENRGDLAAAHAAGHELLAVVPNSEWALVVANNAVELGRPQEAVELVRGVELDQGWSRDWVWGWMIRDRAYHTLGDFRTELDIASDALRRRPDSRTYLQSESKALAALGRIDDVTDRCNLAMTLQPAPGEWDWQPCEQSMSELRAHGYAHAARVLGEHFITARHRSIKRTAKEQAIERAQIYAGLGDWPAAGRALRSYPFPEDESDSWYLEVLSLVQASEGDRTSVDRTLRQWAAVSKPGEISEAIEALHQAQLQALLGDREAAVALLAKAFRNGFGRALIHTFPAFDGLSGYAPFETIVKPVEDPAHLALLSRHQ